jgi:hypothetical protein
MLEDAMLGLNFQRDEAQWPKFAEITAGDEKSPGFWQICKELKGISAEGDQLLTGANNLYGELSVYVHRLSDGAIWSSNGPIFVPGAFEQFSVFAVRTYKVLCKIIDAVIGGNGATRVAGAIRYYGPEI